MQLLSSNDDTTQKKHGAIVVFAKCAIPNKCKTRLIPLLGAQNAADLAQAMLSDVLVALAECVSRLQQEPISKYAA